MAGRPAARSISTTCPARTEWERARAIRLAPGRSVTLRWENDSGLTFLRRFEVDENYMFTVTQSVENSTRADVRLAPYGIIARHGEPSDI
jgi:YidC/Oxa1 family membrane protein insertase